MTWGFAPYKSRLSDPQSGTLNVNGWLQYFNALDALMKTLSTYSGSFSSWSTKITTWTTQLAGYAVCVTNVPVNGFSYQIPDATDNVVFKPAGALAAGTVVLPAAPTDGQRVSVTFTKAITALTVSAAASVVTQVTSIPAAGAGFQYIYNKTDNAWYLQYFGVTGGGGGGTGTVTNTSGALAAHAPVIGNAGNDIKSITALTDGQIIVGQTGADPIGKTVSGDAALAASGALTLASTAVAAGSYTLSSITVDAKGRITAASSGALSTVNIGQIIALYPLAMFL